MKESPAVLMIWFSFSGLLEDDHSEESEVAKERRAVRFFSRASSSERSHARPERWVEEG